MIRWLKRIGIGVLALILLVVVSIGMAYAVVGRRLAKRYPTEVAGVAIPTDSASLAKGEHFTIAVAKCVGCHGDNLGGKKMTDDALIGRLYAPNLTSGNGGVAAGYTDVDWVRGTRHGVGTDGRALMMMPSEAFYYMTDADLASVIAYIKTVKPVDYVTPDPRLGPLGRVLHLAVGFPFIHADLLPKGVTKRPTIQPGPTVEYGKYLSVIGGCTGCHNPNLSGGGGGEGGAKPANLTPAGLKGWTEADFIKAMRTGVRPGGRVLSAAMPWPYIGKLSDEELRATWLYLQSLPPKQMGE